MKKRGQISTIFIVAIAVVLVIVVVFLVREFIIKSEFQVQYEKHINVPLQVEPIRKYMDECVLKIASQGVDALGQQGGYIDLPYEPLPTTSYTPLSSFLEIFPNSGFRTALWFRETPNGIKETKVPTLQEMETQLENYLTKNINRCTNNLTAFIGEGYSFEFKEKPTAKVNILDNAVDVQLNYPITVIIKDLKYPLKNHLAQVPASLGRMYKIGKQILDAENEKFYLEKLTLDQLIVYDEIPFSGVDLTCTPKIWSKAAATQKIKEVLSKNIQQVKIKGTDYTLPNDDFIYYEFDALQTAQPDIKANLLYSQSWPTLVEVSPSSGDIMKGSQISQKVNDPSLAILSSFFCLSNHHFVYDIKYPVLISLTDKAGYIFQFATEVIIDNNQPRQNTYEQLDVPEAQYNLCDYPSNPITVSTLYPDEDGTLRPLDDSEVVLKCYPQVCNLGSTKMASGEARLTSTAPSCANAVIEARKQDFYPGKITLNTNELQENVQPIILEPYYNKNITIKIIDKQNGEVRDPYESEQVVVQFQHKLTDYTTSVSTPIEEPVKLLIGEYEITSYVIGGSTWPITYPEQTISHCVDVKKAGILSLFGGTEEKCFDVKIPSAQLDSAIKGGVKFEYEFTRKDLSSDSPLIVYTMAQPIPASLKELSTVYQSIENNKLDPKFRYPEI